MMFKGLVIPTAVVFLAAAVALAIGPASPERTRAIGFAAGVCFAGAFAAWFVTLLPVTSAAGRVAAPLAAVSLRIFPALLALGWLQTRGAALRAAGADRFLVGFYLAMLAAEVIRAIMEGSARGRKPRKDEVI
jgi:apolipoprotein N-acyltransferase